MRRRRDGERWRRPCAEELQDPPVWVGGEKGGVFSRLVYFTCYIGAEKEGEGGDMGDRPILQEML